MDGGSMAIGVFMEHDARHIDPSPHLRCAAGMKMDHIDHRGKIGRSERLYPGEAAAGKEFMS